MNNAIQKMAGLLKQYKGKKILLATHMNPDGDAIGSLAGMGHIMTMLGCEVRAYLVTGMPASYTWIDIPWETSNHLADFATYDPDLLIVTDCGDAARTGPELSRFLTEGVPPAGWSNTDSLNIDHHEANPLFANHNLVFPKMAATGELVALLARCLGFSLEGKLGEAIYLCLVTDSGHFSYGSTSPLTHDLAQEIVGKGLNVARFTSRLENNWSIGRMNLWGSLMAGMKTFAGGGIVSALVTSDMLKDYGVDKDDLEGFASWMRRLKGSKVSLFIRQDGPQLSKISLRSMGDIDIRPVAAAFGGGGHKAAAGAEMHMEPLAAQSAVLEKLIPLVEAVMAQEKKTT